MPRRAVRTALQLPRKIISRDLAQLSFSSEFCVSPFSAFSLFSGLLQATDFTLKTRHVLQTEGYLYAKGYSLLYLNLLAQFQLGNSQFRLPGEALKCCISRESGWSMYCQWTVMLSDSLDSCYILQITEGVSCLIRSRNCNNLISPTSVAIQGAAN